MPAPGTLQILAQMGMTGQQAGQQFRQQAGQQQALQNPALTQGLNEQQMAALQTLPPGARAQVLSELAFTPPPSPVSLGEGDTLVDPRTGQPIAAGRPKSRTSADYADALAILGHDEESLKTLSPSEQVQVRNQALQIMQRLQRPGVSISNVPAPPSGYRNVFDKEGRLVRQEQIPGGPADQEQTARERATARAGYTVLDDVDRALSMVEQYGRQAAGVGSLLNILPETPANVLKQHIQSIQGNIAVDQLLKIKQQGAGLGHVPQKQLEMLASLLGRLDPSLPPDVLAYNLRRVGEIYQNIVDETAARGKTEDLQLLFKAGFGSKSEGDPYSDLVPEGGN